MCYIKVQHGREPADVDFCSITIDGGLDNDILQQRLHALVKQREELQQMEIELRAQNIARSEIIRIQSTFDAQIKEHGNANCKLQVLPFLWVYSTWTCTCHDLLIIWDCDILFRSNCMKRNRRCTSWREGWKKRKESCMLLDWTMKRLA